jgi:hypothetical protein
MNQQLKNDLLKTFKACWSVPDNRPIHLWAADNVTLSSVYAIPGKFCVDRSRYMVAPLEALSNPHIRQLNVMAPPRSGKSLIAELFALHTIANSSGTMLWLQSSDEMMGRFAELRLMPLIKGCPPVNILVNKRDKFAISKKRLKFPHCIVNLSSAKLSSLQSLGIKTLIGDECWQWEAGFIGQAKARTNDFSETCKIYFLSTGGEEGDDWTNEFNKAPVNEWAWLCPKCNKEQVFIWSKKRDDGTRYGLNIDPKAKVDGKWDYELAAKSAHLQCQYCRHEIHDTPTERRYLNDTGRYICTQPNGNPLAVSYRWNDIANLSVRWSTLVVEYLQAIDTLRREDNLIALKEFTQKRLAQSFSDNVQMSTAQIAIASYNPNEAWGHFKFLTADVQNNGTYFPYVVRVFHKNGDSRKVKHGVALSFTELRQIQLANGIKDNCVYLDSGHIAAMVYSECVKYSAPVTVGGKKVRLGWSALKGSDALDFLHPDGTKRYYAPLVKGDPNIGKAAKGNTCPLYRWSNPSIKNMLFHLRDGKGASWVSPEEDPEYTKQMNSEVLKKIKDKRTNRDKAIYVQLPGMPNHWLDCEAMQLVAACKVGILGNMGAQSTTTVDNTEAIRGETL